MKAEAFGHMGLMPDQFYRMRRVDFEIMRKGFGKKLEYEKELLKLMCASIAAASTGQYPVKAAMEIWGESGTQISIEDIRVRMARHKLLFNKKKSA